MVLWRNLIDTDFQAPLARRNTDSSEGERPVTPGPHCRTKELQLNHADTEVIPKVRGSLPLCQQKCRMPGVHLFWLSRFLQAAIVFHTHCPVALLLAMPIHFLLENVHYATVFTMHSS